MGKVEKAITTAISGDKDASLQQSSKGSIEDKKDPNQEEEEEEEKKESVDTNSSTVNTTVSNVISASLSADNQGNRVSNEQQVPQIVEKSEQGQGVQSSIEDNISSAMSTLNNIVSGMFSKGEEAERIQKEREEMYRSSDYLLERSALKMAAQSRKTNIFEHLDLWNKERTKILTIHESVLASLESKVSQRLKASDDNIKSICALFSGIAQQIYNSFKFSNPIPDVADKSFYPSIREALKVFQEEVNSKKDTSIAFFNKIQSDVINGLLIPEENRFNGIVQTIKNNLLNLKRSLSEQHTKTAKKSMKLKEIFAVNNRNNGESVKKDFMVKLFSFLNASDNLKELQSIVARATVGFWKKSVELEKFRVKIIMQAMSKFIEQHMEFQTSTGGLSPLSEKVCELLVGQVYTEEYVATQMDFSHIVQQEDQVYISEQLKKTSKEISINDVYHFLTKITLPSFDVTSLPLKKLQVQREIAKNNNNLISSTVFITPDCFLLCYDDLNSQKPAMSQDKSKAEESSSQIKGQSQVQNEPIFEEARPIYSRKPDFSMQINQVSFKRNRLNLTIKSQTKNQLFSLIRSSKEVSLVFPSDDHLEEFTQIVKAIEDSPLS